MISNATVALCSMSDCYSRRVPAYWPISVVVCAAAVLLIACSSNPDNSAAAGQPCTAIHEPFEVNLQPSIDGFDIEFIEHSTVIGTESISPSTLTTGSILMAGGRDQVFIVVIGGSQPIPMDGTWSQPQFRAVCAELDIPVFLNAYDGASTTDVDGAIVALVPSDEFPVGSTGALERLG